MYFNLILILCSAMLVGCGLDMVPVQGPAEERIQALDGVKLISETDEDPRNQNAVYQNSYALSPNTRLLMRYEMMKQKINSALKTEPIYLRLFVTNKTAVQDAQNHMQVCPVLKNWMMMATWKRAHPFPGGPWNASGGDIGWEECVSYDPNAGVKAAGCAKPGAICFDVRDWYQAFIVEREVNFGLAIVSDSLVEIHGDKAGAKGPRIHWYELP